MVSVPPAGDETTVKPVIAEPPFDAGAVKVTVAWALPATAVTAVGAPGVIPTDVNVYDCVTVVDPLCTCTVNAVVVATVVVPEIVVVALAVEVPSERPAGSEPETRLQV